MNVVWSNCVFTVNHNITNPSPPLSDNWFVTDRTDTDYNLPAMDGIALKAAISCVFPLHQANVAHFFVGEGIGTTPLQCKFSSAFSRTSPYWVARPYVFGNVEKTVFDNTGDADEDFLMLNATLSLDLRATGRWVPGRLYDYRGARLNPTTGVYAAGVTDGAPMHPMGLSKTVSGTTVTLNWAAVTGATGYAIYRSTTSGGPYGAAVGTATTNSFSHTGASGTRYYVVTANDGTYESGFSDEIEVTI